MTRSSVGREAKIIYLVGQWDMEMRPRVTCSTSGRHISIPHSLVATVRHLLNVSIS